MGIVISKTTYAPFPLVTGIIGIISFVFTLGTFLKVVWVNISTMSDASHEVHAYLTNLRTELLEERASIREMRRRCRRIRNSKNGSNSREGLLELDDVSLKTMADVIRHLVRQFKELERPFLKDGESGIEDWKDHRTHKRQRRRSRTDSPYYNHSAYAPPPSRREKAGRQEEDDDDEEDADAFWAQRTQYAHLTLGKRFLWARRKSTVQRLFQTLSRAQTRRIARQMTGLTVFIHEHVNGTTRVEEAVGRMEERMGRIIGVRRVD